MKVLRAALFRVLIGSGVVFVCWAFFHLSPATLLAAESTIEKAHDHSGEKAGAHSDREKKTAKPQAAPKDSHGHEQGEDHSGHEHDQAEAPHKDEPGKPHSDHKDPQARSKKDELGHDEHEDEQIVRLSDAEMKQ